jgi:hypothetical protein
MKGVMPVCRWIPIAKAKWKAFVVALGGKYDSSPEIEYITMTGFCQVASNWASIIPNLAGYLGITLATISFIALV